MGIIAAAMIAAHSMGLGMGINSINDLPDWVAFSCFTAISLGTMSGGWKIVKTMGTKITKVTPLEGVIAETAGAFTLYITEMLIGIQKKNPMVGFATIGKIVHFVENVLNNILIQKVQIILVAFGQFANKLSWKIFQTFTFCKGV